MSGSPIDATSAHTGGAEPRPGAHRRPARGGRLFPLFVTLIFDIGVTMLIFNVLSARGVEPVWAYLAATAGPLLSLVIMWVRSRRLGVFSLVIIGLTILSAAVTLIGDTSPKVLILKDSLLTGGTALAFLATLAPFVPRPVMFYFAQRFGTDGTAAGMDAFDALWQHEGFRHGMRLVTLVWGVGYLIEAGLRVAAVQMFDFVTAFNIGQILPLVVTAVLITWSMWYGGRMRRRGQEQARAAHAAAGQDPAASGR